MKAWRARPAPSHASRAATPAPSPSGVGGSVDRGSEAGTGGRRFQVPGSGFRGRPQSQAAGLWMAVSTSQRLVATGRQIVTRRVTATFSAMGAAFAECRPHAPREAASTSPRLVATGRQIVTRRVTATFSAMGAAFAECRPHAPREAASTSQRLVATGTRNREPATRNQCFRHKSRSPRGGASFLRISPHVSGGHCRLRGREGGSRFQVPGFGGREDSELGVCRNPEPTTWNHAGGEGDGFRFQVPGSGEEKTRGSGSAGTRNLAPGTTRDSA